MVVPSVQKEVVVESYLKESVPNGALLKLGATGKPEQFSLQACARLAKQRFLPSGLSVDNILLANRGLPGESPTIFDQLLDSFEGCTSVG